ncbi:MAG: hypothetical protein AAGD14_17500 [Planctomycetota bacterium]
MDRGSLSDPKVIEASRDFVCARLATYEDAEEAKFLKTLARTRSGELENSVFCILAPDGKTKLTRGGRGPEMVFGHSQERMVATMKEIAARYKAKKGDPKLPLIKDVRLAVNVAACDGLPLAIVRKETDALAKLAWQKEFQGQVLWVKADGIEALKIKGASKGAPLLVVQPSVFGDAATVLASTQGTDYADTLRAALKKFRAARKGNHRQHVRTGKRQGVHWETEIPVTDPGIPPGGHRR